MHWKKYNTIQYNTKLIYNAPECLELDDSQARIRIKGEVLDGVKISKWRIVGRVDGHVIYDPSAWMVGGFPKESI